MCYNVLMKEESERLVTIETKLAYVEDTVERLNTLLIEHTGEINRLKAENKAFRAKVGEMMGSTQETADQRPPHY